MPELPDVEGFRRVLQEHGTGHRVRRVEVPIRRYCTTPRLRVLAGRWGHRLDEPSRHGKWLQVMQRVLRASVQVAFIPAERGWLTGVRDAGSPRCPRCGSPLRSQRIGGRTSWSCPRCQPPSASG